MIINDSMQIIHALNNGDICSIPTETVYGLAARIDNESAIMKIFETKKRPLNDPLIIHISSVEMAKRYMNQSADQETIFNIVAQKFWPGPITMVVEKNKETVSDLITSNETTVALRMPNKMITREIIEEVNCGLAAPSANLFKKTSPTKAEHVEDSFPETLILDGGPCERGIESTIIKIDENSVTILRPGSINENDLKEAGLLVNYKPHKILTPGNMQDHYQPECPLYLALNNSEYEKLTTNYPGYCEINLSQDPQEAESEIYNKLHELKSSVNDMAIIKISENQLNSIEWQAIIDRLKKASKNY